MPLFDSYIERLEWDEEEFTFKQFVGKFTFPQIVKVIDGYYSEKDEETLGNDQILTVHSTKIIREAHVKTLNRQKSNQTIDLNSAICGAVLSNSSGEIIHGGKELKQKMRCLKYVRALSDYHDCKDPGMNITRGDVLQLYGLIKSPQNSEELIDSENMEGKVVRFPLSCNAEFAPLMEKDDHLPLALIVQRYPPPCTVLVTSTIPDTQVDRSSVWTKDVILITYVEEREVIISTVKYEDTRTFVTFNIDIPVTIAVAKAAVTDEPKYIRVLRNMTDGVRMERISQLYSRGINFDSIGLFDDTEDEDEDEDEDDDNVYEVPRFPEHANKPPPVPPRSKKPSSSSEPETDVVQSPISGLSTEEETEEKEERETPDGIEDDSDNYETIDEDKIGNKYIEENNKGKNKFVNLTQIKRM